MFFDLERCLFLGAVSFISVAVILFSCDYISEEKFNLRFHLLVLSFILSIYFLILRPNLIRVIMG